MLSRCAVPSRFVNAAPACSALLRSVRVPFRAAPRAIQQGNGQPQRATCSPTSATNELHDELLARYEKVVCVHNIHCCGCAEGPDPLRGMADALGGGRRRSGRCGSTSPPPAPHAGCSLCAWTDQACVAGAPRPRHRRSSRRQPCRSARGLTSRRRSPWSSGRTRRSTATAEPALVGHRQWEPAPEWLPRVLVDDAADCVPDADAAAGGERPRRHRSGRPHSAGWPEQPRGRGATGHWWADTTPRLATEGHGVRGQGRRLPRLL